MEGSTHLKRLKKTFILLKFLFAKNGTQKCGHNKEVHHEHGDTGSHSGNRRPDCDFGMVL